MPGRKEANNWSKLSLGRLGVPELAYLRPNAAGRALPDADGRSTREMRFEQVNCRESRCMEE